MVRIIALFRLPQSSNPEVLLSIHKLKTFQGMDSKPLVNELTETLYA
jgi:hypothetical protein